MTACQIHYIQQQLFKASKSYIKIITCSDILRYIQDKLLEARYISEMLSFSMHTRPVVSTKQIKFQVTALSVLSIARLNVAMPLARCPGAS